MGSSDIYRCETPSVWAGPPASFSFSSLKRMGACLRQWQLTRSTYGDYNRYPERPSEAAEVGRIVHELLSQLFQAAAIVGYPPLGSDEFRRVVESVGVANKARTMLDTFAMAVENNPRSHGLRLRATPRDVFNQVAQAFRAEYTRVLAAAPAFTPIPRVDSVSDVAAAAPADRLDRLGTLGVLSEEEVRHPSLPLFGIIDLLVRRNDRTTVLDFKTGSSRPEYREQIHLYALMWWRSTGDLPASVELRYGAQVQSWPVSEDELGRLEDEVAARIAAHTSALMARPAAASVGPHCATCSVRQICGDYWTNRVASESQKGRDRVDQELVVWNSGATAGFVGRDPQGSEVTVVFDEEAANLFGPFASGEKLRILGALIDPEEHGALRLTKGTEVFRVPP